MLCKSNIEVVYFSVARFDKPTCSITCRLFCATIYGCLNSALKTVTYFELWLNIYHVYEAETQTTLNGLVSK